MGIRARQSWARPATPAGAAKRTFCDIYDAQAIATFVPLVTDRNVHPAVPVCNAGVLWQDKVGRRRGLGRR